MLADADKALSSMRTAATTLGAATNEITTQQTFLSSMQTNLTNGVASLVDADMNQVSTRLQALQTQQQLGVQSLSIANQSSQMILKLFQ
jgi:flagellin